MMDSLWGEEFSIPKEKEKTKKVINKIAKPKELKVTVEKQVKSKKLSIEDKLKLINENVLLVLGKQKENVLVIKTREQFSLYIDKCIENGYIAIDTETNNSLDPITCKLMGPCIYTKGEKQAYIPLNHVDYKTGERLSDQLTEQDVKEEFQRLIDNNVFIIMHNGKFDYKVIKCTTGLELPIHWDTLIASKIIDENELSAGLKQQYVSKIDPEQEKYSIDELFKDIEYAFVDPEIFALYAATDSMMTYKLYEWQLEILTQPSYKNCYKLFKEIEMPCVISTAEMELAGIELDKEYAKRLQVKYHKLLKDIDDKLDIEISKIQPQIDAWRLTPEANKPEITKAGKEGKTPNEKLENPISLSSPTQLAILLYDILKVGVIDKKKPRGTGEEILSKINLPICKLMLERRGFAKLVESFVDSLPEKVNEADGRIHCNFNQYGAATGRFSSSEPNLQQIPSHNKEIRKLFCARTDVVRKDYLEESNLEFEVFNENSLNTIEGYKEARQICVNDIILSKKEDTKVLLKVIDIKETKPNYLTFKFIVLEDN